MHLIGSVRQAKVGDEVYNDRRAELGSLASRLGKPGLLRPLVHTRPRKLPCHSGTKSSMLQVFCTGRGAL
jgi:hypothetical protein